MTATKILRRDAPLDIFLVKGLSAALGEIARAVGVSGGTLCSRNR
ncbi:hypothetical protein [Streptomyces acidicola]